MKCYFDCAATTRLNSDAKKIIKKDLKLFHNPSALYETETKEILDESRAMVAHAIGAMKDEIFFTSGGTESNNWVIQRFPYTKEKNHVIISSIEHHSVLRAAQSLKGVKVSYVKPDEFGLIRAADVEKLITNKTALVSVMMVNNILGTIQPIAEIGEICKKKGVLFHTDAVQAVGHLDIDVKELGVDFLSCSGHKLGGPKGVGFLYCRNGTNLNNLLYGGGQERGKRPGTENIPYIHALAHCVTKERNDAYKDAYLGMIQDYLIGRLWDEFTGLRFNGSMLEEDRVLTNVNVSFKDVVSDMIIMLLAERGIYVSEGSACDTGNMDVNYVLKEIGVPDEYIEGGLRITFDEHVNIKQCNYLIKNLKQILMSLRGYV